MPASILIFSRKNGNPLKTYGVNQEQHNMKFTFICIVIVISCGVCASDDLEIYNPRLRYNLKEPRRFRTKKYEHPSYYSKFGFPWQIPPLEEYREFENSMMPDDGDGLSDKVEQFEGLADKIKQFKEVIDFEKAQLNHRPSHINPKFKLNLPDISKDFAGILDEARIFPQEDDFDYNIDDNEESSIHNILDRPKFESDVDLNKQPSVTSERENGHSMHYMKETSKDYGNEFSTNRFKNVEVLRNPSEFAYGPPDSRFYRKTENSQQTESEKSEPDPITTENLNNPPNSQPKVTQRSGYKQNGGDANIERWEEHSFSPLKLNNGEVVAIKPSLTDADSAGVYITAIVAGISAAATVGLIAVGIGWYNLQKHVKNASDVEYPAYGVTGPNKDISPSGDRRLAQSAQMYHYQHQKQQIIAMERAQPGERHGSISEAESEEENEEGDYTVYECPGLAPTGEMEVKNPLFQDDPTPAQTPALKPNTEEKK